MENQVIQGDCLEVMKKLPDNCIDSIVTDPPYHLVSIVKRYGKEGSKEAKIENTDGSFNRLSKGFMGKQWDGVDESGIGIAQNVELWKECLRVLKPGGHLLAFSGNRTYHRMASAIEDAGFEVRDMIEWVYGSGFPKSLNIGKSVNQLETNEWSKISKALDSIDQKSIMEVWKTNAKLAGIKLVKNLTGVGSNTRKKYFVHDIAVLYFNQEKENASAITAELNLCVPSRTSEENLSIAVGSVEQNTELSQELVKSVVKLSENQRAKSWNIFTAQCDVKEWLKENTEVNHRVDEALKTLRGNKKYSNEEITNVLYVALTDILKLTILSQSKTFQNLDTNQKMECASAINVIITEYTAENLISNTVAILKSKAVDKLQGNEREVIAIKEQGGAKFKTVQEQIDNGGFNDPNRTNFKIDKGTSEWEGWGTALKPAHEPICFSRKPLEKGLTIAENCLKWGTGGINIDESRVGTDTVIVNRHSGYNSNSLVESTKGKLKGEQEQVSGRFPANLIHDNSEEVRECFPETKSVSGGRSTGRNFGQGENEGGKDLPRTGHDDSGNASRFFKSIIYQAKSSKAERNRGCEGLELKKNTWEEDSDGKVNRDFIERQPRHNNHPTVKPIALMEYLIKMVTPKDGIVLDPFAGSGTTGLACKNLNRNYILIEKEPEYIDIIKARLKAID